MTKNDVVDGVIELLRNHQPGRRGSIHQEPYKRDFFRLFAAAYNSGLMKGSEEVLYADALAVSIVDRAPELADGEAWKTLRQFWSEWTYAWDHVSELTGP